MGNAWNASAQLPSWVQSESLDRKHKFGRFPSLDEDDKDNDIKWQHQGTFAGLRGHRGGLALLSANILKGGSAYSPNAMMIHPNFCHQKLSCKPLSLTEGLMQRPDVLSEFKILHGQPFRLWQSETTKRQVLLVFDDMKAWILLTRKDEIISIPEAKSVDDLNQTKTWIDVTCSLCSKMYRVESLYHHYRHLFCTSLKMKDDTVVLLDCGQLQYISRFTCHDGGDDDDYDNNGDKWFIVAKTSDYSICLRRRKGLLKKVLALKSEHKNILWESCTLDQVLDSRVITSGFGPNGGDVLDYAGTRFNLYNVQNDQNRKVKVLFLYTGDEEKSMSQLLQAIHIKAIDARCFVFAASAVPGLTEDKSVLMWNGRHMVPIYPESADDGLAPLPHECLLDMSRVEQESVK